MFVKIRLPFVCVFKCVCVAYMYGLFTCEGAAVYTEAGEGCMVTCFYHSLPYYLERRLLIECGTRLTTSKPHRSSSCLQTSLGWGCSHKHVYDHERCGFILRSLFMCSKGSYTLSYIHNLLCGF